MPFQKFICPAFNGINQPVTAHIEPICPNTIKELDQGHGVYPRDVVAHLSLNNTTEIGNLKKRMKRMLEKNELMKGQKNGQYKNMPY